MNTGHMCLVIVSDQWSITSLNKRALRQCDFCSTFGIENRVFIRSIMLFALLPTLVEVVVACRPMNEDKPIPYVI